MILTLHANTSAEEIRTRRSRQQPPRRAEDSALSVPHDIFSPAERSRRMREIRTTGTKPEIVVATLVRSLGARFTRNSRTLPGSPDLSNQTRGWAIFVHGCFWHGHANCLKTKSGGEGRIPLTNRLFWTTKISGNRERDRRALRALRARGFRTLTIWECQLRRPGPVISRIHRLVRTTERSAHNNYSAVKTQRRKDPRPSSRSRLR